MSDEDMIVINTWLLIFVYFYMSIWIILTHVNLYLKNHLAFIFVILFIHGVIIKRDLIWNSAKR